ncbi:hypothetical protein JCGZ_23864 [Jatropha curcas]|uniref:SHSP domain-containing protein n=1 Tax=Jatropha curcas TaxID=180498 RepID=A0A067L3C2_JATCU|nr:swi5-dependent recombination DNA repair protein 1 homolog [Jatropha curcas]KDP42922.1 hypothetical protein JCGZ_23864 [Jatropha curcas]
MDSTRQQRTAGAVRVYEDFEPSVDWVIEPGADTLRVYLPGFKKEQMKVQVTSSRHLRISGERQISDTNVFSRFRKEIPIASNYDPNEISARFEKGILYVKHPKIIVTEPEPQKPKEAAKPPMSPKPAEKPPQPAVEAPKPQKPPTAPAQPQQKPPTPPAQPPQPAVEAPKPRKPPTAPAQPSQMPPTALAQPPQPVVEAPKPQKPPTLETLLKPEEEKAKNNVSEQTIEKGKDKESVKQENENNVACSVRGSRSNSKMVMENYKKVFSGVMMEMKKKKPTRDMINRILVVLIVIIGIYAMKVIRSNTKSDN